MHSNSTFAETGRPHLRRQLVSAATPLSSVGHSATQSNQWLQTASRAQERNGMLHAFSVQRKQMLLTNGSPGVWLKLLPLSALGGTVLQPESSADAVLSTSAAG